MQAQPTASEEYAQIPGYKGYKVSKTGRAVNPEGRELKTRLCGPYLVVALRDHAGASRSVKVHRAVALAWVPFGRADQNTVNHLDGDTKNNCASNLEWVTRGENVRHSVLTGLRTGAKAQGRAVLQVDPTERSPDVLHTSICAAARSIGRHPSSLHAVLDRPGRSAGGYCWKTFQVPADEKTRWSALQECDGIELVKGRYSVSDTGEVRNDDRGLISNSVPKKDGYRSVQLTTALGPHRNFLIHRLVLAAFANVPDARNYDVDHVDGDRTNNRLENLRYLSRSEHNKKTHGRPVSRTDGNGTATVYSTKSAAVAAEGTTLRTLKASLIGGRGGWTECVPSPQLVPKREPATEAPRLSDSEVDEILELTLQTQEVWRSTPGP